MDTIYLQHRNNYQCAALKLCPFLFPLTDMEIFSYGIFTYVAVLYQKIQHIHEEKSHALKVKASTKKHRYAVIIFKFLTTLIMYHGFCHFS